MTHAIVYSNFNSICLICLVQNENLLSVYSQEIISMFEEFTSLQDTTYEKLPKQICNICYWQLKNAYEFKQQCILSLRILNEILAQEETEQKNTAVTIMKHEEKKENIYLSSQIKTDYSLKINSRGTINNNIESMKGGNEYRIESRFSFERITENSKNFNEVNEKKPKLENRHDLCEKSNFNESGHEKLALEFQKDVSENSNNSKEDDDVTEPKLKSRQRRLADVLRKKYNIYDLTCNICKKELSTRATLLRHMETHNKNRVLRFRCSKCNKGFYTGDNYRKHMDRHLGKTKYECDLCSKRFYVLSALGFHFRTTHKAKRIKCDKCSVVVYHQLQLKYHEETVHEKKEFACNSCGKIYWKLCHLKLHQITHSEEKNFTCVYCKKCFKHKGTLKEHIRLQHVEPDRREMCNFCGKLVKPATLRSHLDSHDKETFPCDHCGKIYNSKYAMRAHIKEKHSNCIVKYICKICDRVLSSRGCLATHMRLTHAENLKRIQCHICEKTFKTASHMKAHVNSAHFDIRPHVCQTCSKAFHNKTQLKKHCWSHTGERPFSCHICNKTFAFKTILKTHMKIHLK